MGKKLEGVWSAVFLGMPLGVGLAALIGGGWTVGLGLAAAGGLAYLANKGS
jgi:hypothetical protein